MKEFLTDSQWGELKTLCNRSAELKEKAESIGLSFVFKYDVGIYPIWSSYVLFMDSQTGEDINFVSHYDIFSFEKDVKALDEVEKAISEYNPDAAYEAELAKLNEKYGK